MRGSSAPVLVLLAFLLLTAAQAAPDSGLSRPGPPVVESGGGGSLGPAVAPEVPRPVRGRAHDARPGGTAARVLGGSRGASPPEALATDALSAAVACRPTEACIDTGSDTDTGARATTPVRPRDRTPYGIETIYGNPALAEPTGGKGVDVAVLDTGVATDHPDLRRRIDRCRDYTVEPVAQGACADDNGHGTHVAGTILADGAPDGTGIYGVAPEADLYAFKVCTADRNCTSSRVGAAIRDATDAGAEIVVLSLGGKRTEHVQSAVQYAHREGVLVIASAGNRGPDLATMNYPAADELVVAVGAVEPMRLGDPIAPEDFRVPDFSSRGRDERAFSPADGYLEVSAPGVGVLSTWPGGYRERSGTSVAVPHVAGLAAKLWPLTSDRDDDGHRHEDVRRALQRRAPEFDVTEGLHARRGYDPAAGLGLPQVRQPRARISYSPAVPSEGQAVRFSGAESTAPDGALVDYEWDFDRDGTVDARGRAVSVVFLAPGRHTVWLRVTDTNGASSTATQRLRVNAGPTAAFAVLPPVPVQGEPARFDASGSTDPDGTVAGYEWDFDGDGRTDARGPSVTHTFGTVGTHPVTLRVTDDDGAVNATTRPVLVNDRPAVSYTGPSEVPAGAPVTLTATVTDEIGSTTVTWAFPDGTSAVGPTVPRAFDPGRHVVSVTAEDEYGARSTLEVTVTARAVTGTPAAPGTPTVPGTTATPSEGTTSPPTDDGTSAGPTARPGPGFGGAAALVAAVALALIAFLRRDRSLE